MTEGENRHGFDHRIRIQECAYQIHQKKTRMVVHQADTHHQGMQNGHLVHMYGSYGQNTHSQEVVESLVVVHGRNRVGAGNQSLDVIRSHQIQGRAVDHTHSHVDGYDQNPEALYRHGHVDDYDQSPDALYHHTQAGFGYHDHEVDYGQSLVESQVHGQAEFYRHDHEVDYGHGLVEFYPHSHEVDYRRTR